MNFQNQVYGIQPNSILSFVLAYSLSICEHFDSSIDAGSRYYEEEYRRLLRPEDYQIDLEGVSITKKKTTLSSAFTVRRVYDVNAANFSDRPNLRNIIVNSSCIGESPGKKLDQCRFNGYLRQLLFWKIWTHQNSDLSFVRTQSSRKLVLCYNRIWENDDSKSFKRKVVSVMISCAIPVE